MSYKLSIKKAHLLLIGIGLMFSSCKMIQLSDLHTNEMVSRKLPSLHVINTMNASPMPAYGMGGYGMNGYGYGGYGMNGYGGYGGYNMYFK
ncbi:MAG: hypothetical protein ACYDCN_08020 [Bacteroidia bacterium]